MAVKVLNEIKAKLKFNNYTIDRDVAKISIVGAGMQSTPGIAARMFSSFGKNEINIEMITTSEIKISCLIKKDEANKALKVLHREFNLDKINN
jgi:aspartate kinase